MRAQPGAQQRPEPFHGVDVDFMEAIAVFVAGIFARAVADALVLVAPAWQAGVDIVFIRVDPRSLGDGRLDLWFDRCLFNVLQHMKNDLPAALDQSEDGRFLLFQSAAARRSLEAPAPARAAFFWVAAGLPLWPATT